MHYNRIMTDAVSQPWLAAEQEVERPVIWKVMTIMWCQCINNASNGGFGVTNDYVSSVRVYMVPLLLNRTCCWKTVEWPVIWNAMTVMLRHSNDNATKRDFGTTIDYIFNKSGGVLLLGYETPWFFCCVTVITILPNAISVIQMINSPIREFRCFFISAKICCWVNCQRVSDLGRHYAHVASL